MALCPTCFAHLESNISFAAFSQSSSCIAANVFTQVLALNLLLPILNTISKITACLGSLNFSRNVQCSTSLSILSTSFCNKCLEKINITSHGGESKTNGHTCDPEKIATYEMIKRECKACPGCGEPISKINGCDQMWCTKCHVAFSWDTGKIDYGNVHNPHFIEWERMQGKMMIRQPGEILCGGLPEPHVINFLSERSN